MTKDLIFASWGEGFQRIIKEFPITILEKAHNDRQPYMITVGKDPLHPFCFLNIASDTFVIGFLAEYNRKYLQYLFVEKVPQKLFLCSATYYEFEGDKKDFWFRTDYNFNSDGTLIIVKSDLRTRQKERLTAQNKIDVSANWEDYPAFGCYDGLIKIERGLVMS